MDNAVATPCAMSFVSQPHHSLQGGLKHKRDTNNFLGLPKKVFEIPLESFIRRWP